MENPGWFPGILLAYALQSPSGAFTQRITLQQYRISILYRNKTCFVHHFVQMKIPFLQIHSRRGPGSHTSLK